MLAVELQVVVGGDAVGDDERAGETAEVRLFRRDRWRSFGMLPSDNSLMAPPRSKPMTAPSLTATLEVPFSDCTIAASVAPRPETFQATSALPASQST